MTDGKGASMTEPPRIEDELEGYTGPKNAVFSLRSRIDADCEFCGTKPHQPCPHTPNEAFDHTAELSAVKAERDAALRDAERYRWLRLQNGRIGISPFRIGGELGEYLDALIDAAREGK